MTTRSQAELMDLLHRLLKKGECETVEFKRDHTEKRVNEIADYFSGLSNQANIDKEEAAWLVYGVEDKNHTVVGTDFLLDRKRLDSFKLQIHNLTGFSFRSINELSHPNGRVLILEIPPAPQGMPVSSNGQCFGRTGSHLVYLDEAKREYIKSQQSNDWSAAIVPGATVDDIDREALVAARRAFSERLGKKSDPVDEWTDEAFLTHAGLMNNGKLNRAAILLLGKPESRHFLRPNMVEITWILESKEQVYEHFGPPFFLNTTRAFNKIRQFTIKRQRPGTLFQDEIQNYDSKSLLEVIHNCIVHSNYSSGGGRIFISEYEDKCIFTNSGSFVEATPEDYIINNRKPTFYRNPALAEAMTNLNMIDRIGYGIKQIFKSQQERYLPLPEYHFPDDNTVETTIYGSIINEEYTDTLMSNTNLSIDLIVGLDKIQKGYIPNKETVTKLRDKKLIQGSGKKLRISPNLLNTTSDRVAHIQHKTQDYDFFSKSILNYINQYNQASRAEIDKLLYKYLDDLTDKQRVNKVDNILRNMREKNLIVSKRDGTKRVWVRSSNG